MELSAFRFLVAGSSVQTVLGDLLTTSTDLQFCLVSNGYGHDARVAIHWLLACEKLRATIQLPDPKAKLPTSTID